MCRKVTYRQWNLICLFGTTRTRSLACSTQNHICLHPFGFFYVIALELHENGCNFVVAHRRVFMLNARKRNQLRPFRLSNLFYFMLHFLFSPLCRFDVSLIFFNDFENIKEPRVARFCNVSYHCLDKYQFCVWSKCRWQFRWCHRKWNDLTHADVHKVSACHPFLNS